MNEHSYDSKHLQEYKGILTSPDARNDKFKMELKAEDNPIMERRTQKEKSTIEVEFRYNRGPSTMFFHNWQTCQKRKRRESCNECDRVDRKYDIFLENLNQLQFGDTFRIKAALINEEHSELPAEIHNFENYQPLLAACTEYCLRLDDTPEGINKKYEREQQRLQGVREAEEKRKEEETQARKNAKWTKRKEKVQQLFGDSPYMIQIITTAIGSIIAGIILTTFFSPIPRLFQYIYRLIFPN